MAQLVGHLSADFSSFTKAVDESVVKLKGFESSAGKVGDSLQRMADRFDGRKVIQDAILMAEAVEQIGGASKLTDDELQKLGRTATEAVQKMERMGMEVPAGLKDIADKAKTAEGATLNWKDALLGAASAFGIAFSLNTMKDFVLGVIDAASKIGDLSVKLGISAEAVQRFQYAADLSGASLATVDRAIKTMNDTLATGSKSTVGALEAAGLKFADIRNMSPENAFVAIGDAVARIEDPMLRATVATELFGKAGQELLPMFLAGIQKVGDETAVMSDKTIARLKAAEDAWGRLYNSVKIYTGEIIAETFGMGESFKDFMIGLSNFVVPSPLRNFAKETLGQIRDVTDHAGKSIQLLASPAITDLNEKATFSTQVFGTYTPAISLADAALAKFADTTKAGLGPQFDWQKQLALTKWQTDQLTVSETQLYEATDTLTDFVAAHKGDMFPEPPQGSLDKWKAGQQTIVELPPQVSTLRDDLGLLAGSFAQVGQIGGKNLSDLSRNMGSLIGTTDLAFKGVDAIKNGLKSGFSLSGISSIISGFGGIVSAASIAIGAIQSLWSAAKGGEEGQVVNPARDAWFGGRSVQDIGDQLAPFMSGEDARKLIANVFNAKTNKDFGAASGEIDRILRGNSYAQGTGGFKDFGSGTLAMLHGREAVVPEGQALGGSMTVVINAQGAFFDTPGDLQRLAEKVNDALTAKYGLTNRARAA